MAGAHFDAATTAEYGNSSILSLLAAIALSEITPCPGLPPFPYGKFKYLFFFFFFIRNLPLFLRSPHWMTSTILEKSLTKRPPTWNHCPIFLITSTAGCHLPSLSDLFFWKKVSKLLSDLPHHFQSWVPLSPDHYWKRTFLVCAFQFYPSLPILPIFCHIFPGEGPRGLYPLPHLWLQPRTLAKSTTPVFLTGNFHFRWAKNYHFGPFYIILAILDHFRPLWMRLSKLTGTT